MEEITQYSAVRIYLIFSGGYENRSILFHWGRYFGQIFQWEGVPPALGEGGVFLTEKLHVQDFN